MPEFKVGDRVLVEVNVVELDPFDVDFPIRVERFDGWPNVRTVRPLPPPLPPGVLGYSEEGHEIRRGATVPQGWERRLDYVWLADGQPKDARLYECRPPERQQTVEEAARELIEWDDDGVVPSWPLANLRVALERAENAERPAERQGRSDG